MKIFKLLLPAALLCTLGAQAQATGWPVDYQGVMLQANSSDSDADVSWDGLKAQADELSRYFSIIRVPNCTYGAYPIYWFDFDSAFGPKLALREMVMEFANKNVSVIGDVVLNHRYGTVGESGMNFPFETYNNQSFCLNTSDICSDDDVLTKAGLSDKGGFDDSGEGFAGLCDLDHRSHNVQDICKSHLTAFSEDLFFSGFSYDFVKGYGAEFTKMYNEEIRPRFSVGEYYDASYDMVKNWIDGTGKTSAAYDFPCKFALDRAFSTGDMTYLVWKFNGTTDQPAGLISEPDYKQLAVTLVEDHKTAAGDYTKFNGDVVAANAFILFSPGTPCVYLPHWTAHKEELGKLIELRNAVGIHSRSEVRVLKSTADCYMAEITGTQGKAVVRIGSSTDTPSGYTDGDLRASGEKYAVWSAVSVPGDEPAVPETLYIIGDIDGGAGWGDTPGSGVAMTKNGSQFTAKGVEFVVADGETKCYFSLSDFVGSTWDDLNANANRYGASRSGAPVTTGSATAIVKYENGVDASACRSWSISAGTYDITADLATMEITVVDLADEPAVPVTLAVKLPGGTLHIPEPAGMELKLTPDEGYQLHSLTLGDTEVTADVAGGIYTVPGLTEPKVLTAVFAAATALNRVEAPAAKVAVYGNRVEISGTDAEAAFYDATGRLIRRTDSRSVELPARSGVVIMTLGGETFKFAL